MLSRIVLPLFGLALLIGWFLPEVATAPKSGTFAVESKSAPVEAHSEKSESADNDEDEDYDMSYGPGVVLERQQDGHFYADVDVDGTEVHFLVDTGASSLALTADDARSLGLSWSDDELEVVGKGASGDVMGKRVMLNNVQLGDISANNIEAAIIPEGLNVSLLGQSFLAKAGSVNIQNDKMSLN